jgi:hypothetical protein
MGTPSIVPYAISSTLSETLSGSIPHLPRHLKRRKKRGDVNANEFTSVTISTSFWILLEVDVNHGPMLSTSTSYTITL